MKKTNIYQGKTDPEGWIVLDLLGIDLDGATKVYLSFADIEQIKMGGDVQAERLAKARALLGAEADDEPEPDDAP
jgi:hypothetical protein